MSDVGMNFGALDWTLATLEHLRIDYSRLTIQTHLNDLGTGGYGTVKLAWLDDADVGGGSRFVTVKMLRCIMGDDKERFRTACRLAREVNVWADLHHPNILPLIGFNLPWDMTTAWIICPYETNGNAVEYLARIMPDIAKRLELVLDTANGLAYLHGRTPPVVHGDLKGTNILIGHNTRAMLCDFGLARAMHGVASGLTSTKSIKGSFRYHSPELVFNEDPSLTMESDMWAWGCLAAEILTDSIPFQAVKVEAKIVHSLILGEKPASLDGVQVSSAVRDVVHKCWETEPVARPNVQECANAFSLATSPALDLLSDFEPDDVPSALKKSGNGWVAVFASEEARRKLDVDLEQEYPMVAPWYPGVLQFSPDGNCLAMGAFHRVILYDVQTGAEICTFLHGPAPDDEDDDDKELVLTVSFSFDGKLLATSGYAGDTPSAVRIWDIASCACLQTFSPLEGTSMVDHGVSLVSFSPNNTFVGYSFGKDVRIHDHIGDTHYTIDALSSPSGKSIYCLAISPDSRHVTSGHSDGSVRIADVFSGTLLATLAGGEEEVRGLAYAPDGKSLVSRTTFFWPPEVWALVGLDENAYDNPTADTHLSTPERTLEVPDKEYVRSLAYSPDGAWITGGLGRTKRMMLWDAVTGKAQAVLQHDNPRYCYRPMAVYYYQEIAVSPVATDSGFTVAWMEMGDNARMQIWRFKPVR